MPELSDAMQKLQVEHARPGFRRKWLSASVIDQAGLRGWLPIIRAGELVKCGGMILAEMPEANADVREAFFAQLDARQRGLMTDRFLPGCWWCRLKRYLKRTLLHDEK